VFSPGFAETLRLGKYTRWVTDAEFRAEHLIGLLWMVGEFDASAPKLLDLLCGLQPELRGTDRAYFALEGIHGMVRGERFDVQEWAQRISRGRGYLVPADLTAPMRSALQAAAPGASWRTVMMIPEGYELSGTDAAGQPVHAYLSAAGAVEELRGMRRRGKLVLTSIISAELAQPLSSSKYTQWAVSRELSERYLRCLLWLVGEFGARAYTLLELLKKHSGALAGHLRALIALEVLSRMCLKERFDLAELERRMEQAGAA